ncbi:squalene/phytoene synthase family protein [Sandarakinorhabdus sp.]|uniref:squalene/phytoene synthase family protein n=1 Tax=Sandarakinorhabdus sp. TaxID=1916663 RepID=UPI003F6F537B
MTDLEIITAELQARDRDRWLACLYAPASARAGLIALFALDCELAQLVASTTEPMLGEIRLAWWRERLEELDEGRAPAQPLLLALRDHALPVLRGAELAGLEDRWLALIGSDAVPAAHVEGGGLLFALAARLLAGEESADEGGNEGGARALGRAWVLGEPAVRVAAPLRPLSGLVALSARDAARSRAGLPREARGSLARQWLLLKAVAFGR